MHLTKRRHDPSTQEVDKAHMTNRIIKKAWTRWFKSTLNHLQNQQWRMSTSIIQLLYYKNRVLRNSLFTAKIDCFNPSKDLLIPLSHIIQNKGKQPIFHTALRLFPLKLPCLLNKMSLAATGRAKGTSHKENTKDHKLEAHPQWIRIWLANSSFCFVT